MLLCLTLLALSSAASPVVRATDGQIDPSDLLGHDDDSASVDVDSLGGDAGLDFDFEVAAAVGGDDEEGVASFGRAAGIGHSSIAAGKQPKFAPPPPPFLASAAAAAGKPVILPGDLPVPGIPPFKGVHPVVDPQAGLAILEYIKFLLESYPNPKHCRGGVGACDFTRFKKCTCMSPAVYTHDGRGNCNLGVTKPDKQVWCYVSDKFGHPLKVCPDSRESTSRPGLYWSRFACITE